MKNLSLVLLSLISLQLSAQLTHADIKDLKGNPTQLMVDVFEEKKKDGAFTLVKHQKYTVVLDNGKIISQIVNDTVGYKTPADRKLTYTYTNNTMTLTVKDFKDNLKSKVVYDYKNNLDHITKQTDYDEYGDPVTTISWEQQNNCENGFAQCQTVTTEKLYKSWQTLENFNDKHQLVNEVVYKDLNKPLGPTLNYSYNDKGQLISEEKEMAGGAKYTTTYAYNDKGDVVHKKTRILGFTYDYTYDTNGNWLRKTETTQTKTRRIVTVRTFTY